MTHLPIERKEIPIEGKELPIEGKEIPIEGKVTHTPLPSPACRPGRKRDVVGATRRSDNLRG